MGLIGNMAHKEQHHERISTFLVASDKAQASQNEIRVALESNDDEAKVVAMQKAIAALLNGEQLPQLFITIVRYVLPSENHMVQKLLLLYLVRPCKLQSSDLCLSHSGEALKNGSDLSIADLRRKRSGRRMLPGNSFQK